MEIYSSEEQQVEAIKRFWDQYGKAILGGVVLGLAVLYGFRFYQGQQRANAEQASVQFSQLIEQRSDNASEDWLVQAERLAEAKAAYQLALDNAGQNTQLLQVKLDDLAHVTAA